MFHLFRFLCKLPFLAISTFFSSVAMVQPPRGVFMNAKTQSQIPGSLDKVKPFAAALFHAFWA